MHVCMRTYIHTCSSINLGRVSTSYTHMLMYTYTFLAHTKKTHRTCNFLYTQNKKQYITISHQSHLLFTYSRCIHTYTYMDAYTINTQMHAYIYIYIYIYTHTHININIYTYTSNMQLLTHAYTHSHTHTRTHATTKTV
jgi:hypothetical protein